MARTATARWGIPPERESGQPADPADYKGCEIALAVVGGPFSVLEPLVPDGTFEHEMPDLTPGDYQCRYVPIEINDERGTVAVVDFNIPDDSPLGAVDNPTIEVSGP